MKKTKKKSTKVDSEKKTVPATAENRFRDEGIELPEDFAQDESITERRQSKESKDPDGSSTYRAGSPDV